MSGRNTKHRATFMCMPETAIDENDGFIFRQDDIGATRIAPVVDAIAETSGKQCLAHQHFRAGVFGPDV